MKRRYFLLIIILFLLLVHILVPELGIDTISIWLIIIAVGIFFLPEIQTILPYIKSFKAAGTEIEFNESIDNIRNKSLPKVAKNLANNLEEAKDADSRKHNKDIIQKQLDEVFKAGVAMSEYFKNRQVTSIDNVKLVKNEDGTTAIEWDER